MRRGGFTIMELMVTLAIVGIMASMSVVAGQSLVAISRVNSAANNMASVIRDVHLRARASRCGQVMFINPATRFTTGLPGNFPGGARAVVEVAKRDCRPTLGITALYADQVTAWRYDSTLGNTNWWDKVVNTHNTSDFMMDPTFAGTAVMGPTQGVALAFDETGALAGSYAYSMPSAVGIQSTWTNGTAGVTISYAAPNTTFVRSIIVSAAGEVTLQ